MKFSRTTLERLYGEEKKSVSAIVKLFGCSEHKINYWIRRFAIPKRSISESVYLHYNPHGDPFRFYEPKTLDEAFLFGMGLGLYWGEGTRRNKNQVRLGNTDPNLIKVFMKFLERVYGVPREKLKFGLQIFSDMAPDAARLFWEQELGVSSDQFYKLVVTPARSLGTYREKTRYGVLTVHFNNTKLRNILVDYCQDSSVGRATQW